MLFSDYTRKPYFGLPIIYVRFIFAIAAAFGALLIGEHVYLKEYITTDENSYIFQAWLFLQGMISQPTPEAFDALNHRMIINDEHAGWLSRYPPAHSVWLMPGVAVDNPRLMIAVAAFLSVWFLTKAGERLKIPLWITVGLLFSSPYFWLLQGSILSHTSGLAATALMVWSYLVWLEDRRISFLAIAGLAWSFLFLNRTYTAVLIAMPFALHCLYCLYQIRTKHQFLGTVIFAGCSFVGVILFFIYNYLTTGDPFLPTYLYYNRLDGLGFGVRNIPGHLFTPQKGWGFIVANISQLNIRLWGFWGSLLVFFALVFLGWKNKGINFVMFGGLTLVWLGYGAFWFEGIKEVAPIYYYETLIFIVLLAGLGIKRLIDLSQNISVWKVACISILLAGFVGQASMRTFYKHGVEIIERNSEKQVYQNMIYAVPPNSLVLISGFPQDLLDETSFNPKGIESDPLVMRAGYGSIHLIHRYFPDHNIYHVQGTPPKPPKLIEDITHEIPTLNAMKMLSRTGGKHESGRMAQAPNDPVGPMAFGIKQMFLPGTYEIEFHLNVIGNEGEAIGVVDLRDHKKGNRIAHQELKPGDKTVVFKIELDDVTIVEPRVHFLGKGRIEFDKVEMRLLNYDVKIDETVSGL